MLSNVKFAHYYPFNEVYQQYNKIDFWCEAPQNRGHLSSLGHTVLKLHKVRTKYTSVWHQSNENTAGLRILESISER